MDREGSHARRRRILEYRLPVDHREHGWQMLERHRFRILHSPGVTQVHAALVVDMAERVVMARVAGSDGAVLLHQGWIDAAPCVEFARGGRDREDPLRMGHESR